MKSVPSLLEIQCKPELMKNLSEPEFQNAWEHLVRLSKDLDTLEGLFIKEYSRRVEQKIIDAKEKK